MITLEIDNKSLWQKVLGEIESEISKANFSTWFKDTEISKVDDGIVFISVQNAFVRDWIANKYHKNILKILREASEHIRGLDYTIAKVDQKKNIEVKKTINTSANQALPLSDHYIDQEREYVLEALRATGLIEKEEYSTPGQKIVGKYKTDGKISMVTLQSKPQI
jgi:chromosomal replication initiator protein